MARGVAALWSKPLTLPGQPLALAPPPCFPHLEPLILLHHLCRKEPLDPQLPASVPPCAAPPPSFPPSRSASAGPPAHLCLPRQSTNFHFLWAQSGTPPELGSRNGKNSRPSAQGQATSNPAPPTLVPPLTRPCPLLIAPRPIRPLTSFPQAPPILWSRPLDRLLLTPL